MGEDWEEKTADLVELLADENWHDLDNIEEICIPSEDEREEVLEMSEKADLIEIRRENGEISEIKGTEVLKKFEDLPEEQ